MAIDVVHVAYTKAPADPRVRRAAAAASTAGLRVVVVALRHSGERAVERSQGVVIARLAGRRTRGSFLSYLLQYAAFTIRCRILLSRHRQFRRARLAHVHTLPDFLIFCAIPLRHRGARLVLDLHEILPEFIGTKFPGWAGKAMARAAIVLERWARRQSNATVTVNRPIARLLEVRAPARSQAPLVIHNTPDPADFGDVRPPGPPPNQTGNALRCVYHGTITALYGLDIAVHGVVAASRRGVQVHFTIIGDGPDREHLQGLVRSLDAQRHISFVEPQPPEWLRLQLPTFDAGIVPTRLDGMTRYSLSNKLLEYVHLGVPILAARLPSYIEYFSESSAWFWTPNDSGALAAALIAFTGAASSERLARAREAQSALAAIAWPRERLRLLSLYHSLMATSEPTAEVGRYS